MYNNDNTDPTALGLNELQTLLRQAVQNQDFVEAKSLSDELFRRLYSKKEMTEEQKKLQRHRL